MKRISTLGILLLTLSLWSCHGDAPSGKEYTEVADKSENFKVSVQAIFPEDDALSLYYTTDGSTNFAAIKPIWKEQKAGAGEQEVVFSLPGKVLPTQLRIDFGKNRSQKDIVLKQIAMSYKGKKVTFSGTLIFSYFRPDFTKTQFNATKATLHGIVKNGVVQSPSLYPKEGPLAVEIKKLLE